jgi:hypothetical protein
MHKAGSTRDKSQLRIGVESFNESNRLLGNHDYYWMVFEPFQTAQPESIYGSISHDLADIWRDLKVGLLAASTGKLSDAICDSRFSFEVHWGPFHDGHTVRPLFGLLFGEHAISTNVERD